MLAWEHLGTLNPTIQMLKSALQLIIAQAIIPFVPFGLHVVMCFEPGSATHKGRGIVMLAYCASACASTSHHK